MTTLSIYQKTCPACLAIVSTGTDRCECGYSFEAENTEAPSPEEQSAYQDELFRSYLAARLEQAMSVLEAAQAELAANPKNYDKARAVMKALHEVQALRAEGAGAAEDNPGDTLPGEAFRAEQAARAAEVIQRIAQTAIKECPACRAVLPATCALCFCGHVFPDVPAPSVEHRAESSHPSSAPHQTSRGG